MRRREIISWCLYDFANSIYAAVIVATVWAAYYTNTIVGNDAGVGDLWWGRAISGAMLLVAITSPFMGALAEALRIRKLLLVLYTLVAVAGTAGMAWVEPGMIGIGFALTVVATFGFEGAMVFYNSYLIELADIKWRGRLSGWAYATGYAGSFLGLLAVLPLVKDNRFALTFFVVAAGFLLFAMPALIWLPSQTRRSGARLGLIKTGFKATIATMREIVAQPNLRKFLLSYFVYVDGVNTVIYFSSVFAATTLGFEMSELIGVFLVVQATALIGSLVWAAPTDRWGPRRVILLLLVQWACVVVWAYYVADAVSFYFLAGVAGSGLGAVQAASRTLYASLIPKGKEGEYFGFYSLCGKSASIAGPLVFGAISVWTGGNQRLSILSVLGFLAIGAVLLLRVKDSGGVDAIRADP